MNFLAMTMALRSKHCDALSDRTGLLVRSGGSATGVSVHAACSIGIELEPKSTAIACKVIGDGPEMPVIDRKIRCGECGIVIAWIATKRSIVEIGDGCIWSYGNVMHKGCLWIGRVPHAVNLCSINECILLAMAD